MNNTNGIQKELWLAGGCFWGLEKYLSLIKGVEKAQSGYANGNTKNGAVPTYKDVCTGETGFAETVYVKYNPQIISLEQLLYFYFQAIDPVSVNRQGGDTGEQYRTGIYYNNDEDFNIIKNELEKLQNNYKEKIAVEAKLLENFYPAENYHQKYLDKNPGGYCHISLQLFQLARDTHKYKKPLEQELAKKLTPLQYEVSQNKGTEQPFENEYNNEFRKGIYVDIASGEPLFMSADKFNSGCGWPAFSKPINKGRVTYHTDTYHGMQRIEVRSTIGDSHLGHVFNDGPVAPENGGQSGLRYCINSASLRFIPEEDMEKEGYGEYIPLL